MANDSIMEQIGHETFGAAILVHWSPWPMLSLLNPLSFLWSTLSPWPQASPPSPLTLHSKPNPYPWWNICFVFIVICELSLSFSPSLSLKCWNLYMWIWVCFGRERSVWSVLGFIFDKKCVRVMFEREVGYRVVTKENTGG